MQAYKQQNGMKVTPNTLVNKSIVKNQQQLKTLENEPLNKLPLEIDSDNEQAKWEKAVEYRDQQEVYEDYNYNKKFSLNCELHGLDRFGVGIRLFFQLLKYLAVTYWIMTFISIYILVKNSSGKTLDQIELSTNSLAIFSVSNLPALTVKIPPENATDAEVNRIKAQNDIILEKYVEDQQKSVQYIQGMNGAYLIVFGIFYLFYRYKSNKIIKESEFNATLPSQYTIEVTGFPKSISDPNIIKQHFEKMFFVEVFECHIARRYFGTFSLRKKLAMFQQEMQSEIARQRFSGENRTSKINSLKDKIQELQHDIDEEIKYYFHYKNVSHDLYPSIKAYVVFNQLPQKHQIKKQYNNIWRKLFQIFGYWPKNFKLQGKHHLKINFYPEEPSNIIWENIEVSGTTRTFRAFLAFILVLVIMMITFSIIIFANIVKPQDQQKCPKQTILKEQINQSELYKECYCMQQSFSEVSSDQSLRELCWDTWSKYLTTFALSIITGLVILIVNFLLKKLIERLNSFNRYSTVTQQSKSTLQNLFLALFINTTIITLIIQANIEGFIPAVEISRPIPPIEDIQRDKKQEFEVDFDRSWYLSIGTKITITMMYFVITHFLSEFILGFFYRWRREVNTKSICGKVQQRKANLTLQGPEFNITYYYAAILNVVFTTLFYSSGIPILIPIGAVILTMQYWVYKYRFLRICKKPPSYDAVLNETVMRIIPLSVILHVLIGCYMYGQPLLFPSSKSEILIEINKLNKGYEVTVNASEDDPVNNRFSKTKLFLGTALAAIILILYLYIIQFICSLKCCNNQVAPYVSREKDYDKQYHLISKNMIASYDIRKNENYKDIINTIDYQAFNISLYKNYDKA